MDGERYTCSICYHFTAPNMAAVLRHIGSIHAHQAGFRIVCGNNGCPRSYRNYGSFRKHLYRKHSETVEPLDDPATFSSITSSFMDESEALPSTIVSDEDNLKKSLTLFILKNKEIRQISQLALNGLLGDISLIFHLLTDSVSMRIASTLNENGINYEDISGLHEILQDEQLHDIFKGMHTTFLQKNLFRSIGLVVSITIKLEKR